MITARRTRLLGAPDLAGARAHLAAVPEDAFVLLPTRAAAAELRRVYPGAAPRLGTRTELYEHLLDRLPVAPRRLSDVEREAVLAACAREADEAGHPAPFHVRPALVGEMLALYDHVRRLGRSVDDLERLFTGELEPAAESDRGAAQLLEQTRFLVEAFRRYEARIVDSGAIDEHLARRRLIDEAAPDPLRHLVIAVGDRPFDADGYWPADVTLFTTLPGLERLDILATDGLLAAGYAERLALAFVELETVLAPPPTPTPTLMVPPGGGDVFFAFRDREDELEGVARRVRAGGAAAPLDRTGLVVARPLPYLYVAREVLIGAGLAFDAHDSLPLAAEPYAAAVDVVLECVAANFTRGALLALLRSPHFRFAHDGAELDRRRLPAFDRALAEQRYLGGLDRLRALAGALPGESRGVAAVAVAVAEELAPLAEPRPMADHCDHLRTFLDRHDCDHAERRRRARAAVEETLTNLAAAFRRHDPESTGTVTELSAALRRRIGAHTFAVGTGTGGLRILDAAAARFADLDDVQLLGLIDGEWPERPRRNVFYPRALMVQLEPPRPQRVELNEERDHVRWSRALFMDLLGLARHRVRVSTFALEADAVVEPSAFLEDLPAAGLPTAPDIDHRRQRVLAYETLIDDPAASGSPWAAVRARGGDRDPSRFAGEAGEWTLPRVSVSRLERYLKCPFQFYAANVLQLEEEPRDENARSPLERGRFLHELFETFFHEWQTRGRGRITPREMDDARQLFAEIAEPALRGLPAAEAALERARLFGSAVGSGIADRVFAMEAERGVPIRERLMEYELDDEFTFTGESGDTRAVRLRAKIDRVDVLEDGTFRLIDYKTKYVPDRRTALQLPIYSACVRTSLARQQGRDVPPSEAMYLSFEGPQAVVPLEERGRTFAELTEAAGHRLVATLNDIARGHYPPRPEARNLCSMCGFVAVCRTPGGVDDDD